jgi:hypothetical protein
MTLARKYVEVLHARGYIIINTKSPSDYEKTHATAACRIDGRSATTLPPDFVAIISMNP